MLDNRVVELLEYLEKHPNAYIIEAGRDMDEVIILYRHIDIVIHRIEEANKSGGNFRATLNVEGVKLAVTEKYELTLVQSLFETCRWFVEAQEETFAEGVFSRLKEILDSEKND